MVLGEYRRCVRGIMDIYLSSGKALFYSRALFTFQRLILSDSMTGGCYIQKLTIKSRWQVLAKPLFLLDLSGCVCRCGAEQSALPPQFADLIERIIRIHPHSRVAETAME